MHETMYFHVSIHCHVRRQTNLQWLCRAGLRRADTAANAFRLTYLTLAEHSAGRSPQAHSVSTATVCLKLRTILTAAPAPVELSGVPAFSARPKPT